MPGRVVDVVSGGRCGGKRWMSTAGTSDVSVMAANYALLPRVSRPIESRPVHILFVCSGNVCRSVIAERLTRAYAVECGLTELTAESAGIRGLAGYPVEPRAAAVISGLGGDPTGFRARRLSERMVAAADLILAMTDDQRDRASTLAPGASPNSFTLPEAHRIAMLTGADTVARLDVFRDPSVTADAQRIADPVGLSDRAFMEVGDRIAEALFPLLTQIAPCRRPTPSAPA